MLEFQILISYTYKVPDGGGGDGAKVLRKHLDASAGKTMTFVKATVVYWQIKSTNWPLLVWVVRDVPPEGDKVLVQEGRHRVGAEGLNRISHILIN